MPYLNIVNNFRTKTAFDKNSWECPFNVCNCVYIKKLSKTFVDIVVFKKTLKSNFI